MNRHETGTFAGLVTFMLILASCGSPTANQNSVEEAKLIISASSTNFQKGQSVTFLVTITSSESTHAVLEFIPSGDLELETLKQEIELGANKPQTIHLNGRISQAGYHTLTAQLTSDKWNPLADMYGFNAVSDTSSLKIQSFEAAANTPKPSEESVIKHLDNLPIIKDFRLYAEQNKAEREGRDNVRRDFILKDAEVRDMQGGLIKLDPTIVVYEPKTGSGKPQNNPQSVRPQNSCGTQTASVHLAMTDPSVPTRALNLSNNRVYIYDDNSDHMLPPTPPDYNERPMNPTLIAQGYLDNNGNFTFQKPICDTVNGDGTPPDIFFAVESLKPFNAANPAAGGLRGVYTTWLGLVTYTHTVVTGVNWNTGATNFDQSLPSNSSTSSNAIWLQTLLWHTGVEFMRIGTGNPPPVNIFWPGYIVLAPDNAYAPVSRIVMGTGNWSSTYPVVHEYGHNVRYYWDDRAKYNCALASSDGLSSLNSCLDPNFSDGPALLGSYTHYDGLAYFEPKAGNEGWASTFYVLTRDWSNSIYSPSLYSFAYTSASACNRGSNTNTCYGSFSTTSGGIPAFSERNELRVSTFWYRYVREIMNCPTGLASNLPYPYASLVSRLGQTRASTRDLWNNYLYRSFPSPSSYVQCTANGISTFDDYRRKLRTILYETTMSDDSTGTGSGYSGSFRIP